LISVVELLVFVTVEQGS